LKQIVAVCQCWLLTSTGIKTGSISGSQKNPQTQAHFVKHLALQVYTPPHTMTINVSLANRKVKATPEDRFAIQSKWLGRLLSRKHK